MDSGDHAGVDGRVFEVWWKDWNGKRGKRLRWREDQVGVVG